MSRKRNASSGGTGDEIPQLDLFSDSSIPPTQSNHKTTVAQKSFEEVEESGDADLSRFDYPDDLDDDWISDIMLQASEIFDALDHEEALAVCGVGEYEYPFYIPEIPGWLLDEIDSEPLHYESKPLDEEDYYYLHEMISSGPSDEKNIRTDDNEEDDIQMFDDSDPFFERTLLSDQEIKTADTTWRVKKVPERNNVREDRNVTIRSELPPDEQSADDWVTSYDREEKRMKTPSGIINYRR